MEKFEKQFEDLDVQSGVMENSMSNSVTTSVPQVSNTQIKVIGVIVLLMLILYPETKAS